MLCFGAFVKQRYSVEPEYMIWNTDIDERYC
jgi:hypothetical protein